MQGHRRSPRRGQLALVQAQALEQQCQRSHLELALVLELVLEQYQSLQSRHSQLQAPVPVLALGREQCQSRQSRQSQLLQVQAQVLEHCRQRSQLLGRGLAQGLALRIGRSWLQLVLVLARVLGLGEEELELVQTSQQWGTR